LADYNALPPVNVKPVIVEVDATDSSISMAGGGFKYFEHTKHIRKLKLHKCNYVYDDALYHLPVLSFSLRDLQVSSCPNVTDDGILALSNILDLEKLYMYDLPGVQDREKCLQILKNFLPKCDINFPWAKESERPVEKPRQEKAD
jgi:H+-transporting ATP synthase F0 complex subunit s